MGQVVTKGVVRDACVHSNGQHVGDLCSYIDRSLTILLEAEDGAEGAELRDPLHLGRVDLSDNQKEPGDVARGGRGPGVGERRGSAPSLFFSGQQKKVGIHKQASATGAAPVTPAHMRPRAGTVA